MKKKEWNQIYKQILEKIFGYGLFAHGTKKKQFKSVTTKFLR